MSGATKTLALNPQASTCWSPLAVCSASRTHLTSWSRFVIANLKIHLGCSQQESLLRERTVYSVPCLPCMAMLWQSPTKHGTHMLNLHLSKTLPVPFSYDRMGYSKSHTHCCYSETNTWQRWQPLLMYKKFKNYLLCALWFISDLSLIVKIKYKLVYLKLLVQHQEVV